MHLDFSSQPYVKENLSLIYIYCCLGVPTAKDFSKLPSLEMS